MPGRPRADAGARDGNGWLKCAHGYMSVVGACAPVGDVVGGGGGGVWLLWMGRRGASLHGGLAQRSVGNGRPSLDASLVHLPGSHRARDGSDG